MYLVVDTTSSYNNILGRPTLNLLVSVLSILHLILKYPLLDKHVGTIKGDQAITKEYYQSIPSIFILGIILWPKIDEGDIAICEPKFGAHSENITPTKYLKEVQIRHLHHQVTMLGTFLSESKVEDLISLFRKNTTSQFGCPQICLTQIPYWYIIATPKTPQLRQYLKGSARLARRRNQPSVKNS